MPDERENDRPSGEGRDRRSPARRGPQPDRARHVDRGTRQGDRYGPAARRGTASTQERQPRDRRAAGERDESRADPPTDPEITGRELDDEVRSELSTLSGGAAGAVARHLVMAGRLLDDDPALAYHHALAARRRAARVGVVREAAGVAAYAPGRYADALAELAGGSPHHRLGRLPADDGRQRTGPGSATTRTGSRRRPGRGGTRHRRPDGNADRCRGCTSRPRSARFGSRVAAGSRASIAGQPAVGGAAALCVRRRAGRTGPARGGASLVRRKLPRPT